MATAKKKPVDEADLSEDDKILAKLDDVISYLSKKSFTFLHAGATNLKSAVKEAIKKAEEEEDEI